MKTGKTIEIWDNTGGLEAVASERVCPSIKGLSPGVYIQKKSRRWEAIAVSIVGTLNVTVKERKILNNLKVRFNMTKPPHIFILRDGEHF